MYFRQYTTDLATRMVHGSLKDFDPKKESIEDFIERFEFYCLANNIKGDGDHARRKKALFIGKRHLRS